MQFGLEGGIACGIVLATVYFAAAYAKSQVSAIGVVPAARSSVVRTVEQQASVCVCVEGGSFCCCSFLPWLFVSCGLAGAGCMAVPPRPLLLSL